MKEIKIRESYQKEGFKNPVFEYRSDWPYISVGFGDEKDFFIENLSLLISSGMGIINALSSLKSSIKNAKMKRVVDVIEDMVQSGSPLWKAFQETKFLSNRVITLIRSGEEAGRLPEHLNLVTIQQHKEKVFKSRLKSALLYPGVVLILAIIVGIGSAWAILPDLVTIFSQSNATLPVSTRILIWLGVFLKTYGIIFVPLIILFIITLAYFIFFYKKNKIYR